jgi:hypothetical protein
MTLSSFEMYIRCQCVEYRLEREDIAPMLSGARQMRGEGGWGYVVPWRLDIVGALALIR